MKRRFVSLVTTVGFFLALSTGCDKSQSPQDQGEIEIRSPAPIVCAIGRLEPETGIVDVGAPSGSIILSIAVKSGDLVVKGAEIAKLRTHNEMVAALEMAKTRLQDNESRSKVESRIGEATVRKARLNLQVAKDVLRAKIQSQRALVRQRKAELEQAERDLRRSEELNRGDVIPATALDQVKLAERAASETLAHDQAVLEQLKVDRKLQLELGEVAIESALAESARRQTALELNALRQTVAVAEAAVERTIIRSPGKARVIKVLGNPGERVLNEPIVQIGDPTSMFVVAEIYETDIHLLDVGLRAEITSRAFPEKLSGKIEEIGTLVEKNRFLSVDPTIDVDARIVEARIRLDDTSIADKYNQHQVDVTVFLDKATQ